MKLRTKYLLFVFIIHTAALVLSFYIFRSNAVLFIISELVIAISVIISWILYKQLIAPLQLLMHGVDAIRTRDFNIRFVKTGSFEMDELIGVYNQMIDELRNERTKQEEQHLFLEKLIQTSPTGIIILDHDEKVVQINPRASFYLGLDEKQLKGKFVHEVDHPLTRSFFQLRSTDSRAVRVNGTSTFRVQKSHFIDRGFPRQFITLEELTEELMEAEKRAYGKVIRMMAHEVNNTVGPVNSIIDSVLRSPGSISGPLADNFREALQVAFERNNNLNIFMRNFADVVRIPAPARTRIDLHHVLQSVVRLVKTKALESGIQISFEPRETSFYITADQQQMEQVFINIIKNAIEAAGVGGSILVETFVSKKMVNIIDNGPGITESVREHLFSPFFSTKKDGQGIGLTVVRDILTNHGCSFSLSSETQGRTVFSIKFA